MTVIIDDTAQDIYDKVVQHLAEQKVRSINTPRSEFYGCAYRSDKGLKCAIGCLIENDQYKNDLEGNTIGSLIETKRVKLKIHGMSKQVAIKFVSDLQTAHDCAISKDDLVHHLIYIAGKYHLKFDSVFLITEWSRQ